MPLQSFAQQTGHCEHLLQWIYRDLKVQTIDLSYQRVMNKLLLGLYSLDKKTKTSFQFNEKMTKLFNAIKEIDPKLKDKMDSNWSVTLTNLFSNSKEIDPQNIENVIEHWMDLQKNEPELFKDLPKEYHLDSWDLGSIKTINQFSKLSMTDMELKSKFMGLAKKIQRSKENLLEGKDFDEKSLEKLIRETNKDLVRELNKHTSKNINDYKNICSEKDLINLMSNQNFVCPMIDPNKSLNDLTLKLEELQSMIPDLSKSDISPPPKELIKIHPVEYKVNPSPKATYCLRDEMMAEYLVVHHTATNATTTPHNINWLHTNNSSNGEPWYMVGYNYLISSTFEGASEASPQVFKGRDDNMKGAHAGGYTLPLTDEKREEYSKYKIQCGNTTIGMKEVDLSSQQNRAGGISGNIVSQGVAVIGNFAPVEYKSIDGVLTPLNFLSTRQEEPSLEQIDALARLACTLQKKNPNLKTIVPHSYFKNTSCPGSLVNLFSKIKGMTEKYGCSYEVKLTKEGK